MDTFLYCVSNWFIPIEIKVKDSKNYSRTMSSKQNVNFLLQNILIAFINYFISSSNVSLFVLYEIY